MLGIEIDENHRIAILTPTGKLTEADFASATKVIDPYIAQYGTLNGLIIATENFPGWDSFAGLLSHLSFIKDHHKKILYVALVTDSYLGSFGEYVASHFVSAEIMAFEFHELELAKAWIAKNSSE